MFSIEKNLRSQNLSEKEFLGKKIWRKGLALKSKKVQDIFAETFILALLSSAAVFCLQIFIICFAREIKGFY